jgi:hypothetical protein
MPIILSAWEAEIRRFRVETSPGKYFLRPYLQNNQSKMGWKYGSNSRAPVLQEQSPKFKPQSHTKKKTNILVRMQRKGPPTELVGM